MRIGHTVNLPPDGSIRMRIGLVAGMEYANLALVRRIIKALGEPGRKHGYGLVLTSDNAACNVAQETCRLVGLPVERLKRCQPHKVIPRCKVLFLLYDGRNHSILLDLANYAVKHAPETQIRVFGPDGPITNGIAFLGQCRATFRRGYGGFGSDPILCSSSE